MTRANYEDQLSFATAEYLDLRGLLYTHFPAGEHRHVAVGRKLKRMGLKRGVPDYLVFNHHWEERGVFSFKNVGLAIELKSPKGKQTKAQKRWAGELRHQGWRYEVCRTINEVIAVVEDCYGHPTR